MPSDMNSNSSSAGISATSSSALIRKLCLQLTKQPEDAISSTYRYVVKALSTAPLLDNFDEFVVIEKIKKKLVKEGRHKDALDFCDLCRRLQNSTLLQNRCSILTLMLDLCGTNKQYDRYAQFASELARIAASANSALNLHPNNIITARPYIKNKFIEELCQENWKDTKGDTLFEKENLNGDVNSDFKNKRAQVASLFSRKEERRQDFLIIPKSSKESSPSSKSSSQSEQSIDFLLQRGLIRDILYISLGITGNDLCWQWNGANFTINAKSSIPHSSRKMALRFAEAGVMYMNINKFCKLQSIETTAGLVSQSFIAALQLELNEYYRILATLQAQLTAEIENRDSQVKFPLTLHRLTLWFQDPFLRLKVLAALVDACAGNKGGALASVLFSHLQHGDTDVQNPVKHLLIAAIQPFYEILNNWIFCGELEDKFNEFFITVNAKVNKDSDNKNNDMWHEKYSLNKAMIPSFFSMDQAKKILSTGKAINFLREVCQNHAFVRENERLKKMHDARKVESLFTQENDGEFQLLLEENYRKTSSLVLNVLHNRFKLMEHFQAMRDYFLLGQGDFIRHLMDLLDDDLGKPANLLFIHNLTGILESAVRATNAQYHDPEVLQRLDVRLLDCSIGDTGWDVFSLDYNVDGPMGTILTEQCINLYLRLFTNLWRAKRMEYLLSNMWQSRTMYLKIQEKIPQVKPIAFQSHIILAQMIHFVQQMQYYVAFEVMECSWADLLHKINTAYDLDQVISAHEKFLDTLATRSFLNEESALLHLHLKAIYDFILEFQRLQENFWSRASSLVFISNKNEMDAEIKTEAGDWGTSEKQSREYQFHLDQLIKCIPSVQNELQKLFSRYKEKVQNFLIMLNDRGDQNLSYLGFRLDFNEYFKNRNQSLHTSLTYQHRRRSSIKHL